MIYYVSGGTRSGKTHYAMNLALSLSDNPVYIATARNLDVEMNARIDRHQRERSQAWQLLEEDLYVSHLALSKRVIMIDCVTLWLTNWFMDKQDEHVDCEAFFLEELNRVCAMSCDIIFVSNEIGLGLHADTSLTRRFVDIQGRVNQHIANMADHAYFLVSGQAITLK